MASHGAHVAAHVAVIRRLVDEGRKHDLSPEAISLGGLELVERWLGGEPVAFEALERVNEEARAEHQRVWNARDDGWKFHSNLGRTGSIRSKATWTTSARSAFPPSSRS